MKVARPSETGYLRMCLCRWGGLTEIVTDNGAPLRQGGHLLGEKYHIHHIRISVTTHAPTALLSDRISTYGKRSTRQ